MSHFDKPIVVTSMSHRNLCILTEGFKNTQPREMSENFLRELRRPLVRIACLLGVKGANVRWHYYTLDIALRARREQIIGEVQRRKLPGCNLASRWRTGVLINKLIEDERASSHH